MKSRLFLAIGLLIGVLFGTPAKATLVLDVGPGDFGLGCDFCGSTRGDTFGWAFDVISTIQVDGIGVWDDRNEGIVPEIEAGLWTNAGALLASATLTDMSPTESSNGDGVWRFKDMTTQVLTPGRYVVGSVFFTRTPLALFNEPFTTISEVAYVGGRTYVNAQNYPESSDMGLQFPSKPFGSEGVFGPTLRVASTPVPEPTTLALVGLGLAAFGFRQCRKA